MSKKLSDHEKHLIERFRENPQNAVDYLNVCLADDDPQVFLLALRDVAKAFGGMTKLSQKSRISREHLYTTFSKEGNPAFSSLNSVLDALDLKIVIAAKKKKPGRKKTRKTATPMIR